MNNTLNNSKNKKIIKFKRIYEEKQRISYVNNFNVGNRYRVSWGYGGHGLLWTLCGYFGQIWKNYQ